ncbi:uncharacterized protein LOC134685517 [Mytilus trossulus]|uniref:uncharacterized protein LOC134685517 n=1 Tax=Mytilus trossulus TaxID=6551 RepID=UPI0030043043
MFKIDAFRTKMLRSLISKIETCRILPCHIHSQSNKTERERLLAKLLTKHYVPDIETVKSYKIRFPEPVKLIEGLYQPLKESRRVGALSFHCTSKFDGRLWKACLQLTFPLRFTCVGVHSDLDKAKENAYLEACEMYWYLGLLYNNGCVTPERLWELIEQMYVEIDGPQVRREKNFYYCTSQIVMDGISSWLTEIKIRWPLILCVNATGTSPYNSQFEAALLAAIQLKCHCFLDGKNNLKSPQRRSLRKSVLFNEFVPSLENFDADCIIHVDASFYGFGAYLNIKNEGKVRWFTELWPQEVQSKYLSFQVKTFSSRFAEMYAFVTACYTWKHKFVNKRVLCYSDCLSTVDIVNRGLYVNRKIYSKYSKLTRILQSLVDNYNIEFLACHKQRESNRLADLLSRHCVEEFRKEIPEAFQKSKKVKQLTFCYPLVENDRVKNLENHHKETK